MKNFLKAAGLTLLLVVFFNLFVASFGGPIYDSLGKGTLTGYLYLPLPVYEYFSSFLHCSMCRPQTIYFNLDLIICDVLFILLSLFAFVKSKTMRAKVLSFIILAILGVLIVEFYIHTTHISPRIE
jgi:hypothetical protein